MAAGASAALLGSAAYAQDAALEEIIVTAERRATSLQNTPLSIIALTANTVEAKGIDDLSDLNLFTPNLSIMGGRTGGNNAPTFTIRGIGGGGGAAGERGVGMYIDGIYVPRTAGSVFRVFDIDRVEVLRGPQGTLFGRNSTGGAIRLFTKQPSDQFDAYVRGTLGNFDRRDIVGMVNLPINDKLAIRAQAGWLNQDGYVQRGEQQLGSSKDKVLRLQAAWQVAPNVKATFGAFYSDSKSSGNPADLIEFDMRPGIEGVIQGNYADWLNDALKLAGQAPLAAYNDPRVVLDDYTAPGFCFVDDFNPDWDKACALSNDNKYTQLDANIVWSLNEKTSLTLLGGWSQLIHTGGTDSTLLGFSIAPDNIKSQVIYQEAQLNTSLFNDRLDVVLGGSYFYEKGTSHGITSTRRGTSVFPSTARGDGDAGMFISSISTGQSTSNSFGVFLSSTWHVTDKLNVTGGLRWAHDKKAIDNTQFGTPGNAFFTPAFVPAPGTDRTRVTADHTWNQVDWRATVDYHFTDAVMAYATASKAYKAGAYSYVTQQRIPGELQSGDFITPIPPEKVINYEAGARTTWFNNRLRINPTVFYMQWTNRQAARNTTCIQADIDSGACPNGFRVMLTNTGDIDIWGLEVDGMLSVSERLTVDFGLGLTDYKLLDVAANGGPNLFPSQASPTYNFGATYNHPLGDKGDLGFNISYSYVAAQETYPNSDSDASYKLPSYDVVNSRLTWRTPDRKISVSLFANNLLDKSYGTFASAFGGGFWDAASGTGLAAPLRKAVSVIRARPREFGVTAQFNF